MKIFKSAVIIGVLTILAIKPIFAGFYHDDWSTVVGPVFHGMAFSLARLSWSVHLFLSRPVSGFSLFLFSSLADKSPYIWQILMSTLSIGAIYALSKALKAIGEYLGFKVEKLDTLLFASLMIIFPWFLGGTIFVTAAISVLLALTFFSLSTSCFFKFLDKGRSRMLFFSGVFYMLCIFSYEAFYFQFLILGAIGIVITRITNKRIGRVLVLSLTLGLIQVLAIAWNRFSSPLAPAGKTLYLEWLPLFIYTVEVFSKRLWATVQEASYLASLAASGYLFSMLLVITEHRKNKGISIFKIVLVAVLSTLGVIMSILLYAFAGYGVAATGITSRTLLVPSFFIMLGLFVVHLFMNTIKGETKTIYLVSLGLLVFTIFAGYFFRFREWKQSWQIQKSVIDAAPKEDIETTNKNAVIVYIGPTQYGDVTIFQASWDINGAINYSLFDTPECRSLGKCNFRTFITGRSDWETNWDGTTLTQVATDNNSVVWQGPAKEVWLWNYYKGTFSEATMSANLK